MVNIDKIIFYLKSHYSTRNEKQRTFIEENEGQIPWKREFSCTCEDCISYFFRE